MQYSIPLSYNPIDASKIAETLSRFGGKHHNQITADFEEALKTELKAPHVVAVSSGTAAIHLALKILGVGHGDTVIVPTFTYVATINPVLYLGAEPIFIDSEPETWNMDPLLLEKALLDLDRVKKKPKAIIIVHTYGMPAKMDEIMRLAATYQIPVIEDAAEALGSTYKGKAAGTLGDIGVFSFNNNKVFTAYGGGALVLKTADLAQKSRFYSTQAREQLPYYEHKEVGYNYAMSPLCSAAALSQLPDLTQNANNRRRIFELYKTAFLNQEVQFQHENALNRSNRWFSAFLFRDEATRRHVEAVLMAERIETRPVWKPMHLQAVFKGCAVVSNGLSEDYFKRGLCLPCSSWMEAESQKIIINLIIRAFGYN